MMMPRGRPVKSPISGGSSLRVAADLAGAPRPEDSVRPAAHDLLVALVHQKPNGGSRQGITVWPVWLVPAASRRPSPAANPSSRTTSSPRKE